MKTTNTISPVTKPIVCLSIFCAAAFWSGTAPAATFDFANLADTDPAAGVGESAWNTFNWTDSGISVSATARNLANTTNYYVYMDAGDAGMGVCKTLIPGGTTGAQFGSANLCDPAIDDQISMGEVLELVFSEVVSLDLTLVNGLHNPVFTGNFGVAVDPIIDPTTLGEFTQLLTQGSVSNPILTGTHFAFISNATISGIESDERHMYLNVVDANPVPEPGTLLLLGSGLIGMVVWRTKKT